MTHTLNKISLLWVLVKYYNDYIDRQSCGRGRGGVTYLYIGDVFVMALSSNANL